MLDMNNPLLGSLLLLVVIVFLCFFMYGKSQKDYAKAMAEYEQKMVEYQALLDNGGGGLKNGVPFTPPDLVCAATSDALAPYFGPGSRVGFGFSATDGQVQLTGIDERTAAMVIAILCEELGGDPSRLRFHSIKAV